MAAVQIRVLGGAAARVPARGDRVRAPASGDLLVNVAAGSRPAGGGSRSPGVGRRRRGRAPARSDAAYVNFLGDEGEERVRAAYPGATWDRLAEVKRRYDPENVFRLNQNVPPVD